jgi:hypothetical protein
MAGIDDIKAQAMNHVVEFKEILYAQNVILEEIVKGLSDAPKKLSGLDVESEVSVFRAQLAAANVLAKPLEIFTVPQGSYYRVDQWGFVTAVADAVALFIDDANGVVDAKSPAAVIGSSQPNRLIIPPGRILLAGTVGGNITNLNMLVTVFKLSL